MTLITTTTATTTTTSTTTRLCKKHAETVAHLISDCNKLAGTYCTKRDNNVASIVYRAICAEYNLDHSKDWWVKPKKVVRNDYVKILWHFPIQTDKHLVHNRPDIVLIKYKEQTGLVTDNAVQRDENIQDKVSQKLTNISYCKLS